MAEMLNAANVNYLAVPSQAKPVAQPRQPQQAQTTPAPDPFRRTASPLAIILPFQSEDQPTRQQRGGSPVRFASPDDHRAMQAAIAANPDDAAPLLVYADMVHEEGHPHLAEAMRKAAAWHNRGPAEYPIQVGYGPTAFINRARQEASAHLGVEHEAYGWHPAGNTNVYIAKLTGDMGNREVLGHEHSEHRAPSVLGRVNLFNSQSDLGGYLTDDREHLRGLLSELRLDPDMGRAGDDRAHRRLAQALSGNNVTLERGPAGTWLLRHDDGRDELFQSDVDLPSLAGHFGFVPSADYEGGRHYATTQEQRDALRHNEIMEAAEHLDQHEGESIEDPGYFDNDRHMQRPEQAVKMARQQNTPDIQAMMAGLHANPTDQGLRLALADSLQEAGRHHEAEALRSPDPIQVWMTHGADPELRLKRGHTTRGAWLDAETPESVRSALMFALAQRINIHISRGDEETGRDTLEEHAHHGSLYVPQPWYGEAPLPAGRGQLMINYGHGMFSNMPVYGSRIVRIRAYSPGGPEHGRNLYRHPSYHHGAVEIRPYTGWAEIEGRVPLRDPPAFEVAIDGKPWGGFRSEIAARRWVSRMGLSPATERPSPERFAAASAPAGGLAVRGIFYPGGERLPEEALGQTPQPTATPSAPRAESKLRGRLRRAFQKHLGVK